MGVAIQYPACDQVREANELRRQGIIISLGGVRSVWLRHDLETFKNRLKALEGKVALEGMILTDSQLASLEKAQSDREWLYDLANEDCSSLAALARDKVAGEFTLVALSHNLLKLWRGGLAPTG